MTTSASYTVSDQLRNILKHYEMTAQHSLSGPNGHKPGGGANKDFKLGHYGTGGFLDNSGDTRSYSIFAPQPKRPSLFPQHAPSFVGQPPFLFNPAQICGPSGSVSGKNSSRDLPANKSFDMTVIKNEMIGCFSIGGEKRLCFTQFLNVVLRDFDVHDVKKACQELNIYCAPCTMEQINVSKLAGVLPLTSTACDLITHSDAHRLCSLLEQRRFETRRKKSGPAPSSATVEGSCPSSPTPGPSPGRPECGKIVAPGGGLNSRSKFLSVCHRCFGRCSGSLYPDLYAAPASKCISCDECGDFLAPDSFVSHAHGARETRVCHWGFDAANWRSYLRLTADDERVDEKRAQMRDVKAKFAALESNSARKRSAIDCGFPEQQAEKRFRALSLPEGLVKPVPTLATPERSSLAQVATSAVEKFLCHPLLFAYYYQLLAANNNASTLNGQAASRFAAPVSAPILPSYFPTAFSTLPLIPPAAPQNCEKVTPPPTVPLTVEEAAATLLKLAPHTFNNTMDKKLGSNSSNGTCSSNQRVDDALRSENPLKMSEEDSLTLENLLNRYVTNPEALRQIVDKVRLVKRSHDENYEILMAQNRILHQEIAYLRGGNSSGGKSNGHVTHGHQQQQAHHRHHNNSQSAGIIGR